MPPGVTPSPPHLRPQQQQTYWLFCSISFVMRALWLYFICKWVSALNRIKSCHVTVNLTLSSSQLDTPSYTVTYSVRISYKEINVPLKIYKLLYVGHRFSPEAPTMPEAKHYILTPTPGIALTNLTFPNCKIIPHNYTENFSCSYANYLQFNG